MKIRWKIYNKQQKQETSQTKLTLSFNFDKTKLIFLSWSQHQEIEV